MAKLFCSQCAAETEHLPIYLAAKLETVSRSTIYYRKRKGWIHFSFLPSKKVVICRDSLVGRKTA